MNFARIHIILLLAIAFGILAPKRAQALPVFARQTGFPCQTCHTAFPDLNSFGRIYKEQGYRLSSADDPAGPWAFKELPFAIQANVGASGRKEAPEETKLSVDALQIFMAGPIAPHTSVYIHHHLIMADEPGPLHEAQVVFERPSHLPVMVRFGKFEPWLAQSPGKTNLSHFGYQSLNVNIGSNTSSVAASRFGLGTLWLVGDDFRVDVEGTWNDQSPEAFVRPYAKVLGGEVGIIGIAGNRKITGVNPQMQTIEFKDRYLRAGVDAVFYPTGWLALAGLALQGWDNKPNGIEETARYSAGYLEAKFFPLPKLAGLIRYEQVHFQTPPQPGLTPAAPVDPGMASMAATPQTASPQFRSMHGGESAVASGAGEPDLRQWVVVSVQPYIRQNVKVVGEYSYDVVAPNESMYFLGTHVSF